MRRVLAWAVGLAVLPGPVAVHGQATTVRLSDYVAGLRTVDVRIGDSSETRPFLFDTGGGLTILTPDAASEAGCKPFGRLTGFRSDGARLDGPRCDLVHLQIGGQPLEVEAGVFDLMALLGNTPPISGLIALQTFSDRAITIDLAQGLLVIESENSLAERVANMRPVPLRLGRQAGGAAIDAFIPLTGNPASAWFLVDSGNTGSVIVSPHAQEQLGLSDLASDQSHLAEIHIAGFGALNTEVRFDDRIYDGLLSISSLEQLVITLDLAHGKAWIRRSSQ